MSGFIALHREARDHPLFAGNAERFGAWFWMVASACWKPTKFNIGGTTVVLDRGQLCASRAQLSSAWGLSPSSVERFLARLETEQMIERATGQGRTIITICNYDKYQDGGEETGQATGQANGQRSDSHRTTKEQGNKGTIVEEEANASPSPSAGPDEIGDSDQVEDRAPAKPKRTRKAKAPIPEFDLPDWVPIEAWNGFVEMRIEKGSPPTARAMKLLVGKLDEFRARGHDPTRVLDQSTINRWTDLYEIKDNRNGNGGPNNRPGAPLAQRGGGAGSPRAGFERRAVEARSRQDPGAPYGPHAGQAGSDFELPLAPARVLPRG